MPKLVGNVFGRRVFAKCERMLESGAPPKEVAEKCLGQSCLRTITKLLDDEKGFVVVEKSQGLSPLIALT